MSLHRCCFFQSALTLIFYLVTTQTHYRTAGAAEGATADGFSVCPHSSASAAWKHCYFPSPHAILNGAGDRRHLKGWKEMKELHPTGSHQELGIKPSAVLLEDFFQGFSAAVNNPCATYTLYSPTDFTAWIKAINPGTWAQPVFPDSPIFVAVLCYCIRTSAIF